jgi:Ca-activated chloride channel family protein
MSRLAVWTLLVLASAAARAGSWADLWATPDQQAQHLLDSGRPAQAAPLFSDPRRRAYAELQAGHYSTAARLLAPFEDADSQYNRGNALARAGELSAALAAYDAALAHAPAALDVRHNRDLVARALRQQNAQHAHREGDEPEEGADNYRVSDETRVDGDAQSRKGTGPESTPSTGGGNSAGSSNEQSADPSVEQAQRDAEAAAALRRGRSEPGQQRGATAGTQSGSAHANDADALRVRAARKGAPFSEASTEQALALEQWLRRIPEDPGGLLRRKFLIEHLMREQGSEP